MEIHTKAEKIKSIANGEGMTRQDLEKDILILVLRLMGENLDTFSEEATEVMARWKSKAHAVLRGEHVYET